VRVSHTDWETPQSDLKGVWELVERRAWMIILKWPHFYGQGADIVGPHPPRMVAVDKEWQASQKKKFANRYFA